MTGSLLRPVVPAADRRLAGILATVLVHAALVLAWQLARTPPAAPPEEEGPLMQWVRLPAPLPTPAPAPALPAGDMSRPSLSGPPRPAGRGQAPVPPTPARTEAAPTAAKPFAAEPAPATETPALPNAATIMENARRSVGSIDRALRKESKPLIVAPPDSPAIRMREGMEQAHALAAPRLLEAPKVEELMNNTGDGARRTRVITGNRTYCLTERSPVTNVEMIEMHGKQRFTNCPKHETPAKAQVWRTARD